MARRIFFSFHYERDVWRASIVRNSGVVESTAAAGFHDASIWEEARLKGDAAIKKLINDALVGTTVTAVLIGAVTSTRKYVTYEIEQSIDRGNGIFGILIHGIKDKSGNIDSPGAIPKKLLDVGAKVYTYEYGKIAEWAEQAYKAAHPA
ncbi:MAG: hypothetical protein V7609_1829 [Verrucomicrobiota bacterium]